MVLTEEYLRRHVPIEKSDHLNEQLRFDAQEHYDLFISHSFKDRNLVLALHKAFKDAGYKVYIDWIDDPGQDRTNVNSNTAKLIKRRLKNCTGLAYVATQNIVNSKWCPWELGLGDGMNGKACILPILHGQIHTVSNFKGTEYVGMYPWLDYAGVNGKNTYDFWVTSQESLDTYISLRDWLKGQDMVDHKN